ncbi:MAG: hypothetical protein ACE5DX_02765 [Candidatus Dojkabacteria bacterium]
MGAGGRKQTVEIIYEKIPPIITYILILFPFWGGFVLPFATAYFVIIFNVFFLYKSISFSVFFAVSLIKIRQTENINWLSRLEYLDTPKEALEKLELKLEQLEILSFADLKKDKRLPLFIRRYLFRRAKRKVTSFIKGEISRIQRLKEQKLNFDWKELHHIVIIPHWKEPKHVLDHTLNTIKNSNYPTKRISIVLGAEKRDSTGLKISNELKNKYKKHFEQIWVTNHELTEDEIVGKSSNMAYAGKIAKKKIDKLGWDLKKVTVTSCDADSQLPRNYFANVAYNYVTMKDSIYKYFNAAVVLYANIWRLPFYARVKNSMSSIYNVGRLVRTDKLVPFSTYTTSFWLIDKIGYWTPTITPEDFHIFFKGLFRFPTKVSTIPIYQKVMADAAEGETHLETIKNNYFQERRWSWGISDDGWLLRNVLKKVLSGDIKIAMLYRSLHVMFDHIIGPVSAIIILVGGNIPLLVNPSFAATTTGINLPRISSFMIQMTLWFLLVTILMDQYLKPKKPGKTNVIKKFFELFEWIIQPFVGIILVAIPGIEAHTRLLFGKYLEYYLTKKK